MTFSDLIQVQAVEWTKKTSECSVPSFFGPLTHPGYRDVNLSRDFCDEDPIILAQVQQQMTDFLEKDT